MSFADPTKLGTPGSPPTPALRRFALCGLALIASACVIPDKEIDIVREGNNESPVRLVEPTPLTKEARCACQPSACEDDGANNAESSAQCPQPTNTGLPHLLDPALGEFEFCSCQAGEEDTNRSTAALLWVEDQDDDDEILAAVFLDLPLPEQMPANAEPQEFQSYKAYISSEQPLTNVSSSYDQVEFREKPNVRQLNLVTDPVLNTFDFCNPDGDHIERGWHTLTVMVTDRPWFKVIQNDVEFPVTGVPDIANGATFDTAHYSFFCHESGFAPDEGKCGCEAIEEG
jgi:hypothetical protein